MFSIAEDIYKLCSYQKTSHVVITNENPAERANVYFLFSHAQNIHVYIFYVVHLMPNLLFRIVWKFHFFSCLPCFPLLSFPPESSLLCFCFSFLLSQSYLSSTICPECSHFFPAIVTKLKGIRLPAHFKAT